MYYFYALLLIRIETKHLWHLCFLITNGCALLFAFFSGICNNSTDSFVEDIEIILINVTRNLNIFSMIMCALVLFKPLGKFSVAWKETLKARHLIYVRKKITINLQCFMPHLWNILKLNKWTLIFHRLFALKLFSSV